MPHPPSQRASLSPSSVAPPHPTRPVPDPAPRYQGVLWPPRCARGPLGRRWVPPGKAGAGGHRGPEAQLLLVRPQQCPGAESHAAAGTGEAPRPRHVATLQSTTRWGSLGGATLPGDGGSSCQAWPPSGRAGTRAQTCSAVATVAAVFEATVATLGRAREGGRSPDLGRFHCLPQAPTGKGEKMSLGHLGNRQGPRWGRPPPAVMLR